MGADERGATVSVITPFYNTEAFLGEAIESVLSQTFRDFEYLLIDNRSTDGSLAIAESYAQRDDRIRLIKNDEFLDQDSNFSEGFRHISATSRYAKLVLADDMIFPRYLEETMAVAEPNPSVGIVSSYYLKGRTLMGSGWPFPATTLSGRSVARLQLQQGRFFFGSPTAVLFRSEVVHNTTPFYESRVPHADTEACYRTLSSWDFGFVPQVLSFLRVDEQSRMGTVQGFHPEALDKLIVVKKFGKNFLDPHEFQSVLAKTERHYWRMLGESVLKQRGDEFWRYHRKGLATIGLEIGWRELWWPVLLELADRIFNPKKTVGRLLRR